MGKTVKTRSSARKLDIGRTFKCELHDDLFKAEIHDPFKWTI